MSDTEKATLIGTLMLRKRQAEENIGLLQAKLQNQTSPLKELAKALPTLYGHHLPGEQPASCEHVLGLIAKVDHLGTVAATVRQLDEQQKELAEIIAALGRAGISV